MRYICLRYIKYSFKISLIGLLVISIIPSDLFALRPTAYKNSIHSTQGRSPSAAKIDDNDPQKPEKILRILGDAYITAVRRGDFGDTYSEANACFDPGVFARVFRGYYPNPDDSARAAFDLMMERMGQAKYKEIFWDAYINKKYVWSIRTTPNELLEEKLRSLEILPNIEGIKAHAINLDLIEYFERGELEFIPEKEIEALEAAATTLNKWIGSSVIIDSVWNSFVNYLRRLHAIAFGFDALKRGGRIRTSPTESTGRPRIYPTGHDIYVLLGKLDERLRSPEFKAQHPIMQAAEVYITLVDIHPFEDGNERVAKLIMNYYLIRGHLPPFQVSASNGKEFIKIVRFMKTKEDFADFLYRQISSQLDFYKAQRKRLYRLVPPEQTISNHVKISATGREVYERLADEIGRAVSSSKRPVILTSVDKDTMLFYTTEFLRRANLPRGKPQHLDLSRTTFILGMEFLGTNELYDNFIKNVVGNLPLDNRPSVVSFEGVGENISEQISMFRERLNSIAYIDLAVVGIGANGNILYNERGTSFDSDLRIVSLHRSTRRQEDTKHEYAFTLGIADILRANRIAAFATGELEGHRLKGDRRAGKPGAAMRTVQTLDMPASAIRTHEGGNFVFLFDEKTAADLKIDIDEEASLSHRVNLGLNTFLVVGDNKISRLIALAEELDSCKMLDIADGEKKAEKIYEILSDVIYTLSPAERKHLARLTLAISARYKRDKPYSKQGLLYLLATDLFSAEWTQSRNGPGLSEAEESSMEAEILQRTNQLFAEGQEARPINFRFQNLPRCVRDKFSGANSDVVLVPLEGGGIRIYPVSVFRKKMKEALPAEAFSLAKGDRIGRLTSRFSNARFISGAVLGTDQSYLGDIWHAIPDEVIAYLGKDFYGRSFNRDYFDIWMPEAFIGMGERKDEIFERDVLTEMARSYYAGQGIDKRPDSDQASSPSPAKVVNETQSKMRDRNELVQIFASYEGPIHYPYALDDIKSVFDLVRLFPRAQIMLSDAFIQGESKDVEQMPDANNLSEIAGFLKERFKRDYRASDVDIQIRGDRKSTLRVSVKLNPKWQILLQRRSIDFDYQVSHFENAGIVSGVILVKRPGFHGERMIERSFWEGVYKSMGEPGYVLVSHHEGPMWVIGDMSREEKPLFSLQYKGNPKSDQPTMFTIGDCCFDVYQASVRNSAEGLRKDIGDFVHMVEGKFFEACDRYNLAATETRRCLIASRLLARIISDAFNIPIGTDSPTRIEVIGGLFKGTVYHQFIGVYINSNKPVVLYIDASYGQFYDEYENTIILDDYSGLSSKYNIRELREVFLERMEKYFREHDPTIPREDMFKHLRALEARIEGWEHPLLISYKDYLHDGRIRKGELTHLGPETEIAIDNALRDLRKWLKTIPAISFKSAPSAAKVDAEPFILQLIDSAA